MTFLLETDLHARMRRTKQRQSSALRSFACGRAITLNGER